MTNITEIKARQDAAPPTPEETIPSPPTGYTIELTKPIDAHGATVSRLSFREPTARDLMNIGNPVIFDPLSDPPKILHDERRMTQMMATLGNIPPSSVAAMSPRDWVTAAWGLTPFFIPIPGKI